jgi:putative tricarboxylic transport membrane protein
VSQRAEADSRERRPATREDAIGGIVVLALAAVILIGGLAIPDSSYANAVLSPRDFPWLIGLLMAVAGAVLLLRNALALWPNHERSKTAPESEVSTDDDASASADGQEDVSTPSRPAQNPWILALLLALLLGYILIFVWLGYVLSTFLFLSCATMLLAPKKPVRNLFFAVTFSVIVYLAFTKGLNVQLPSGPLGGII